MRTVAELGEGGAFENQPIGTCVMIITELVWNMEQRTITGTTDPTFSDPTYSINKIIKVGL